MDMIESESRMPGAPVKVYSRKDLEDICEFNPHPAIRRIAAVMLYTMGQRDKVVENLERVS